VQAKIEHIEFLFDTRCEIAYIPIMTKIGPIHDRIRQARERSGLSLRAAAEKMRVAPSTLMHWERGAHSPQLSDVEVICAALECPARWLVFGTGARS
jgi:transcriptional regulator with XRE-family HTH domain